MSSCLENKNWFFNGIDIYRTTFFPVKNTLALRLKYFFDIIEFNRPVNFTDKAIVTFKNQIPVILIQDCGF